MFFRLIRCGLPSNHHPKNNPKAVVDHAHRPLFRPTFNSTINDLLNINALLPPWRHQFLPVGAANPPIIFTRGRALQRRWRVHARTCPAGQRPSRIIICATSLPKSCVFHFHKGVLRIGCNNPLFRRRAVSTSINCMETISSTILMAQFMLEPSQGSHLLHFCRTNFHGPPLQTSKADPPFNAAPHPNAKPTRMLTTAAIPPCFQALRRILGNG